MKLHLVGLPHTQTTREVSVCAFTQKIIKFCKMMKPFGHEIVLYAGEDNDAECDELVTIVTKEQQKKWYGEYDPNLLPFKATWDATDPAWIVMNHRAEEEIRERLSGNDIVLITGGRANQPLEQALGDQIVAEWAAGYDGVFSKYICFESYAWMHHLYGKYMSSNGSHGRWYDCVIPNFFDLEEWDLPNGEKDDYLLFVGRVVQNKGIWVAAELAERMGKKLVIAGSGVSDYGEGFIQTEDGMRLEADHLEYVGTVGGQERTDLMRRAQALLVPTLYIEPFGAVAVEAQLCGTPVISTDWGAFPETVVNGLSGYRFRTLKEGVEAIKKSADLDPMEIAKHARSTYSLEAIAPLYDDWFRRLSSLWGEGWLEA